MQDLSHIPLDSRPGNYYVSVIDGPRYSFIAGPYPTHQKALDMVKVAREKACEVNSWADFYGFGTCRLPEDYPEPPKGKLNDLLS